MQGSLFTEGQPAGGGGGGGGMTIQQVYWSLTDTNATSPFPTQISPHSGGRFDVTVPKNGTYILLTFKLFAEYHNPNTVIRLQGTDSSPNPWNVFDEVWSYPVALTGDHQAKTISSMTGPIPAGDYEVILDLLYDFGTITTQDNILDTVNSFLLFTMFIPG